MGGKAIKQYGFEELRLPAAEYQKLVDEVIVHIPCRYAIIPAYRTKPDYGDCDIIIEDYDPTELIAQISGFKPLKNDKVYSFPYKGFQFDFIKMPKEHFQTALDYYSWNDLGNLIGRAFHSIGVKYGHTGLEYVIRAELFGGASTQVLNVVPLSTDTDTILRFGGYDPEKFKKGFDTLVEIFEFAASGRFFNPAKFSYENLNYINRTRDRKRATYQQFVAWMADTNVAGQLLHEDKRLYLATIGDAFPNLPPALLAAEEKYQNQQIIYSRFNGMLVSEWTGLTGKELGSVMATYKRSTPDQTVFLQLSPELVKQCFLHWYQKEYSTTQSEQ